MVFLFLLMTALVALDTLCNIVSALVQRASLPRYRWNRGGRFTFN